MQKKQPDPEMIDNENPELTRDDFQQARSFKEVFPALYADWKRGGGKPNPKREVKLRIDTDVLKAWANQHPA